MTIIERIARVLNVERRYDESEASFVLRVKAKLYENPINWPVAKLVVGKIVPLTEEERQQLGIMHPEQATRDTVRQARCWAYESGWLDGARGKGDWLDLTTTPADYRRGWQEGNRAAENAREAQWERLLREEEGGGEVAAGDRTL